MEDGTTITMKSNGHLFGYLNVDEDFLNKRYVASLFYRNAMECIDISVEPRMYNDQIALVMHAVQPATGLVLEDFFWSRNELTEEEMKQIMKVGVADFQFTFGCMERLTPDGPVLQFAANKFRNIKLADGTILKGGKKREYVPKTAAAATEAPVADAPASDEAVANAPVAEQESLDVEE